jgi:hypothetical protein
LLRGAGVYVPGDRLARHSPLVRLPDVTRARREENRGRPPSWDFSSHPKIVGTFRQSAGRSHLSSSNDRAAGRRLERRCLARQLPAAPSAHLRDTGSPCARACSGQLAPHLAGEADPTSQRCPPLRRASPAPRRTPRSLRASAGGSKTCRERESAASDTDAKTMSRVVPRSFQPRTPTCTRAWPETVAAGHSWVRESPSPAWSHSIPDCRTSSMTSPHRSRDHLPPGTGFGRRWRIRVGQRAGSPIGPSAPMRQSSALRWRAVRSHRRRSTLSSSASHRS